MQNWKDEEKQLAQQLKRKVATSENPRKEFVTHKVMTTADTTPAQAERVQELVRIVKALRHGKITGSPGAQN